MKQLKAIYNYTAYLVMYWLWYALTSVACVFQVGNKQVSITKEELTHIKKALKDLGNDDAKKLLQKIEKYEKHQ